MPEITIFGMKISIDTRLGRINCCGESCTYTPSDRLDIRLIIDTCGIELFADNGLIYIVGGAKKFLRILSRKSSLQPAEATVHTL